VSYPLLHTAVARRTRHIPPPPSC
jgi:hypothetical protein